MACCCCSQTDVLIYGTPTSEGKAVEILKKMEEGKREGLVKLTGRVVPFEKVTAPLSQREAVFYVVEVEWTAGKVYYGGDLNGGLAGVVPQSTKEAWHSAGTIVEGYDFALVNQEATYVMAASSRRIYPYGLLREKTEKIYTHDGVVEPHVMEFMKQHHVTFTLPDNGGTVGIVGSALAGGLGLTGTTRIRLTEYVLLPNERAAAAGLLKDGALTAADGSVSATSSSDDSKRAKHVSAFWRAFVAQVGRRLLVATTTEESTLGVASSENENNDISAQAAPRPEKADPATRYFWNSFDDK